MNGEKWGNLSYVSRWPKAGKYEMRTGKQSGETARGDQIEDTQNAIVSIHQIKPDDDSKKLVALTFDDGPAEKYTEAYLDILNQYGIHATFFNLGSEIENYPDLSKKVVEQGTSNFPSWTRRRCRTSSRRRLRPSRTRWAWTRPGSARRTATSPRRRG